MSEKQTSGLFIGRFQPFHRGHLQTLNYCADRVDVLWVGIGSANKSFETNNPFTFEERRMMIERSLEPVTLAKIKVVGIPDIDNDAKWMKNLDVIVPKYDLFFSNDKYMTDLFQGEGRKVAKVPFFERNRLSGTNVRKMIALEKRLDHVLPEGTKQVLAFIHLKRRTELSGIKVR